MTDSAVLLILDALACYRLTRLVTTDTITAPTRRLLGGIGGGETRRLRVALFLSCPWCVSVWIAAGVVAAQALAAGPWLYVSAGLAFSAVAGLLAGWE